MLEYSNHLNMVERAFGKMSEGKNIAVNYLTVHHVLFGLQH